MKISVIIPAYNSSKYIKRVVTSVLLQTYENFELVIVDDCSTDNTVELVESFADKRIKIVKHQHNTGAGVARQSGLKEATGEFIMFIDSDDYVKDDFLEQCVAL